MCMQLIYLQWSICKPCPVCGIVDEVKVEDKRKEGVKKEDVEFT